MRCFPFATEIGIWATLDYDPTSEQLALTKVHKCTHASYAHMLLSYSYALIAKTKIYLYKEKYKVKTMTMTKNGLFLQLGFCNVSL